MRPAWLLALLSLAGCSFTPGAYGTHEHDARADSADGCIASGYVDRCQVSGGTPLTLTSGEYTYDTDTGVLRAPGNAIVPTVTGLQTDRDPDLRLLIVTDVVIESGATLYATGALPLAIVASGSITVDGAIDVGARRPAAGAGGFAACTAGAGRGVDDGGGASGGGGGGFGAIGGSGGTGDANGGSSAGGAAGPAVALPADLRGGCPGGIGGTGVDPGGPAGAAGGGVLLSAATEIAVRGVVRAGGGGGGGGRYLNSGDGDGGGGGGGSGGMIVLDAPAIDVAGGAIAANGGGGGGGAADVGAGQPGTNGQDTAGAASGGSGSGTTSADGGTGGYSVMPAGTMPTEFFNGAGGGGGGGVGFVVIRTGMLRGTAVITPAPQ